MLQTTLVESKSFQREIKLSSKSRYQATKKIFKPVLQSCPELGAVSSCSDASMSKKVTSTFRPFNSYVASEHVIRSKLGT